MAGEVWASADSGEAAQRNAIDEATMGKLAAMGKDELISLIKRVGGAMWGIALMDDEAAYEAVRLRLLHKGLTSVSDNVALNLLKEWMDRTKGRAAQNLNMNVTETDPLAKMSSERLLRLERELSRLKGEESLVIMPLPEKLGEESHGAR